MLLPLFPPASRYHVPGNVPHTPPLRPPRAVANLWDPVTNQSTPGQAKHTRTLLWHMLAGSPDITATCHILTSPNTQLRQPGLPGSQCSPWEFKPSNKALGGFKPCSCWGHRNIQDLLHRGEATLVLRHSQGCLYLQGRVQPPSLLSFPILSSHLWWMCCLNQPRSHVTSSFSLGIKGALLGIFKRAKIKRHETKVNLKNSPYQGLEQTPEIMKLC